MSLTVKLALGSIFIGLVVLVLKYLAYWVTGSIALYWCFVLIRFGHRERSPALVADGRHLLTDVFTSAGVLIGVAVAAFTGWAILDPLIAALVALNILWMGYGLMKESVAGLMDAAVSPKIQERIRTLIAEQGSGALQAHDVRTRHADESLSLISTWWCLGI
jgi:cation diffusion facilitator family transporter